MPPTARSILAIVAGFFVIGLLAFGTDAALLAAGVLPPATQPVTDLPILLASIGYVGIYAIFGCWLAATLAPSHPMRHALILGALGLAFQLAMAPQAWSRTPLWYNLLNLALVMPFAWAGGRLRERQLGRQAATPALGGASS